MKLQALVLLAIFVVAFSAAVQAKGEKPVDPRTTCLEYKGEKWCEKEKKCVIPWQFAKEKGFDFEHLGFKSFVNYCGPVTVRGKLIPDEKPVTSRINKNVMPGSQQDEFGCSTSSGYAWCSKENKCVRPWELVKEKGISADTASFNTYCASCKASAGYTWCEKEGKCVRPWELAKEKSFGLDAISFKTYCSAGSAETKTNNLVTRSFKKTLPAPEINCEAGSTWCSKLSKCLNPTELFHGHHIGEHALAKFCSNSVDAPTSRTTQESEKAKIGGDLDENGCVKGAGYSWCKAEGKCVRPWELAKLRSIATAEVSAYCGAENCGHAGGYAWCASEGKCLRPWEALKDKPQTTWSQYCQKK